MKQAALIVIGGLVALVGIVWTLQGLGYIGGSFMSGATLWAIIGPIVVLAGLAIVALGLRGRRRVRETRQAGPAAHGAGPDSGGAGGVA